MIPSAGIEFHTGAATLTLGTEAPCGRCRQPSPPGSFRWGHRTDASYTGTVQIRRGVTIEPRLSWNWVDLPYGDFTAKLVSTRANVSFSTRMSVGALVQYNSSNDAFDVNVRYRWEDRPEAISCGVQ